MDNTRDFLPRLKELKRQEGLSKMLESVLAVIGLIAIAVFISLL